MKVCIDKRELNKMRRRMLKAYPKERIELLWGKLVRDEFHVYLFDNQIIHEGKRRSVEHDDEEYQISSDHASMGGLVLLGSIHSHPDCDDAAPSEFDYDEALNVGECISGIVCIKKTKTGRHHLRIRFWGPLQQVEPVYF